MTEKEYIEICILSQPKEIATKNIIQLLEQKDKRIDDLEKALLWCIDMEKKYDWGDSSYE